jgi:DNA-binding response OmpR family regulator
MRLLVIEDNDRLRDHLAAGLRSVGYIVDAAEDGAEGWQMASEATHDLIILDRMLPELDGLEVLRRLRRAQSTVPVLLLTALDAVQDRVEGLDAGADDYLTKPFAVAELLARVRSLLRRGQHRRDPVVTIADLEVDTVGRTVQRGERRIDLTPREYALLEYLLARPGAVVTRPELLEHLYSAEGDVSANSIEVLIGRLRRKLQPPGTAPILHTRRGFGYRLGKEEL